MFAYRVFGLLLTTCFLAVAIVSAQPAGQPGVKVQPGVKPNVPMVPNVPKGVDPKAKNPVPGNPVPPGKNPGMGMPPMMPVQPVQPVPPPAPEKKANINWPKEIGGKNLDAIIKEMKTHPDPAVREAAVRTLPGFGPKARDQGGNDLVELMTKDQDWNVKLAAVSVCPTILFGYANIPAPDAMIVNGTTVILGFLGHEAMHVRFDAVGVVNTLGRIFRKVQPAVVQKLISRAREASAWQMRRAAVVALGSVGQGFQTGESPDMHEPPDAQAVTALLDIVRGDPCAAVRREAIGALMALGPVAVVQQKTWKSSVENILKSSLEKDKSVLLWAKVLLIRNSPEALKGNEAHLDAIAKTLEAAEPSGRAEACSAIGMLGEDAKSKLGNLIDIINDANEVPEVVIAAITAATAIPSKSAVIVPLLANVKASHKDENVKRVAGEAIDFMNGVKKN